MYREPIVVGSRQTLLPTVPKAAEARNVQHPAQWLAYALWVPKNCCYALLLRHKEFFEGVRIFRPFIWGVKLWRYLEF